MADQNPQQFGNQQGGQFGNPTPPPNNQPGMTPNPSGSGAQPASTTPPQGEMMPPPPPAQPTTPPPSMGGMMPPPPPPPPIGDDDQSTGTPAPTSNYMFGDLYDDFTTIVVIPSHSLHFDESYFLKLLAGSISLTKDEKKKIITSIPKLRQEQIDQLIKILEEERKKFRELSPKHFEQLEKLEKQHFEDWKDLELEFKSSEKAEEDANQADQIRKQLGL